MRRLSYQSRHIPANPLDLTKKERQLLNRYFTVAARPHVILAFRAAADRLVADGVTDPRLVVREVRRAAAERSTHLKSLGCKNGLVRWLSTLVLHALADIPECRRMADWAIRRAVAARKEALHAATR